MAPIATQSATETRTASTVDELKQLSTLKLRAASPPSSRNEDVRGKNTRSGPHIYQGHLDEYAQSEMTPAIGREFQKDCQLSALLEADNDDVLLDLAYTISRRGLCVFRDQEITGEQMMALSDKLGKLRGKPAQSNMCIHPVSDHTPDAPRPKTQTISANIQRKVGGINRRYEDVSRWASVAWHSDVSFENVPADYSMLKINVLPESGGDTMFVSCYDVLSQISPSFLEYLETLTAEHNAEFFHAEAEKAGLKVRDDMERGNPLNKGSTLIAHHPIIRTNPLTGWKALFINRGFTSRIDSVSKDESDMILQYLNNICIHAIDCQARVKWDKGSVAIWDNSVTWHSATFDYEEERCGDRASSIGERPYLDAAGSRLKKDALREEGKKW